MQPHHTLRGSTGTGRITRENPREGFVGDPEAGLFVPPDDRRRRHDGRRPVQAARRSGRSWAWRRSATSTRRWRSRTATATDCRPRSTRPTRSTRSGSASGSRAGMVSVNNSTTGAEAHLPFGGNGRSGNGGAAVRRVGARSVHALAGDELGLLGQAAEGPDGRRGRLGRPVVPADRAVSDDLTRIRAGRLVDVVAGEVLRDRVITIRGDRIESVGDGTTARRSSSTCPTTRCSRG